MIRHCLRLIWNRRRANGLILVELVACFLVLCLVLTLAASFLGNWSRPMGFDTERVWQLEASLPQYQRMEEKEKAETWEVVRQVMLALNSMDEVESMTPMSINTPYGSSMMGYSNRINGREEFIYMNQVLPGAREMLQLELNQGRWLEPGDDALNWRPVVLSRCYAEALYGDEDPIGKPLRMLDDAGNLREREEGEKENRIVGIIEDCRWRGDVYPAAFMQFSHIEMNTEEWPPYDYLVKLGPGVPAKFEESLLRTVQGIAPGWSLTLSPLSKKRRESNRNQVMPLLVGGLISGFLILMVGLGLVGVLWQSVTRRTEEWGLRRALGSTAAQVRRQVLGELMTLTAVGVGIGTLIFGQFPLIHAIPNTSMEAYLSGLVAAVVLIYLFVILCGLYPSWLATRVHPAEALQYD